MMDHFQPLYVDCSIEYELDMTRFPGWDDPWARAQPALMLGYLSPEDELQTFPQKESPSGEGELRHIIQEFCSNIDISDDGLPSFDDVLDFTDDLLALSDTSVADSGYVQSPDNSDDMTRSPDTSSTQSPIVDFLLSPYQDLARAYRKRKMSEESDQRPSAKRQCYYDDDLISDMYSTFTSTSNLDSFEDEMGYELSVCTRD